MQNYPFEGNLINLNIQIDENFLNFIREHSILCSLKSGNFKQVQEFSNDQKFPNEPRFYNIELLRQCNDQYNLGNLPLSIFFKHFGFTKKGSFHNVLRHKRYNFPKVSQEELNRLYKNVKVEKFKETCLKKYGVENVFQLQSVKDKSKETMLERYGTEHNMFLEETKEKIKQTNLERYGVENVFQSDLIKDRIKQTNLERYGVENLMLLDATKEKIKKTNLERYGVEHSWQAAVVKEFIAKTNLERYGFENVMKNNDMKELVKELSYQGRLEKDTRFAELETLTELEEIVAFCKENYSTSHFYKILKRKGFSIPEKFSTPELVIKNLLESLGLKFQTHFRPDFLEGKELDFYIPFSENVGKFPQFQEDSSKVAIAIEINGVYWHSEKFKERNYHQDKKIKCLENGVGLISIADIEITEEKILELLKNPQKILKEVSGLSEIDASLEPFIPLVEVCKQTFHQNETEKSVPFVEGFEFVGFSEPEERFSGYFDCGNLIFKPK